MVAINRIICAIIFVFISSCNLVEGFSKNKSDTSPLQKPRGGSPIKNTDESRNRLMGHSNQDVNNALNLVGATASLISAFTRHLPEGRIIDGRYYPSQLSLSRQIGLQSINALVGDVYRLERKKALKAVREVACKHRNSCVWRRRLANIRFWLNSLSEEEAKEYEHDKNVDCDVLYPGCLGYY